LVEAVNDCQNYGCSHQGVFNFCCVHLGFSGWLKVSVFDGPDSTRKPCTYIAPASVRRGNVAPRRFFTFCASK
jgi:hypothetical protein